MLQIALAVAFATLPCGKILTSLLTLIGSAARLAAAVLAGVVTYGVSMRALVMICAPGWWLAAVIYTGAIAAATTLSICVTISLSPKRMAEPVMACACGVAVLLPVVLCVPAQPGGGWHAVVLLYAAGAVVGCGVAKRHSRFGGRCANSDLGLRSSAG